MFVCILRDGVHVRVQVVQSTHRPRWRASCYVLGGAILLLSYVHTYGAGISSLSCETSPACWFADSAAHYFTVVPSKVQPVLFCHSTTHHPPHHRTMTNRQCLATQKSTNADEPIFEIVESPIPSPGPSEVLIRVLVSLVFVGLLEEGVRRA